ncbi:Rho GTPase-activating protein [Dirofilaria immitis]
MTVATLGYTMVICGNSDDPQHRYRGRIEKVKFGVPIEEAFVHDIPATLLVLLLKVHKDGPSKKDIWRAPGNQAQVRKLSHIMQHGRLVNIANFSVYTAASVIKKFLSKLPGGIFGLENEQKLFDLYNTSADLESQRQSFCRVLSSLSIPSQHLLILLFGTFYMISESADAFGSRMTTEALGISVAPSLFHSCIHDGQRAKIEDVIRFKIASEIITRIIENFGYVSLFPRENYEYYARITGRTLRFDENESRLRFITPSNVLDWPVPPPSTYSIMAARCAGSYSMASVAAIDHINSNCGRHSDHNQQQYLQNMFKNVSIWAANRADCMRNRGETGKVNDKSDVKILHRPIKKHCLSVDGSMENNEFEPSLLTSITNLQPQQRTSGYPYTAISDYRRTFFGTGPQHITIATIADDELISKNAKSVL